MGTHARPRRRVRGAALGTLAVGATLTGVGLTAAALDPSGAGLADGTLSSEPVNFAASGLGAPVPVADVSSLDGSSSVGKGVLATGSNTGSGTNGAPAVEAPSTGYGVAQVKPVKPVLAAVAKNAAKAASASRVTPASNTLSTIKSAVGSNTASGISGSGNSGSGNTASAANAAPKTGAAAGKSSTGTSMPQLPSLDASLPISTALPVPSLPTLPTISNLSTTVSHAKTTLAGLLNEVAGLV